MQAIKPILPDMSNLLAFDYSIYLAAKLYEDGIMSSGQAASIANLSKRSFIEIMGKYGVSLFGTSKEELLEDIANA
jgi:predicted HTH domain antitoxin